MEGYLSTYGGRTEQGDWGCGCTWYGYRMGVAGESQCRTQGPRVRTNEIWGVNLGGPLWTYLLWDPGSLPKPSIEGEREQEVEDQLGYTGLTEGEKRPGHFARRETRDLDIRYLTKTVKNPRLLNGGDGVGLKKGPVPRGPLTDRVILI